MSRDFQENPQRGTKLSSDTRDYVDLAAAEFVSGCEYDGVALREVDVRDRSFADVTLEDSLLWKINGSKSKFENLTLTDLRNARFSGATLKDLDLRGSHLAGLQIEAEKLKGTIVDPSQLLELSTLLGLVVKEQDRDA